MAGSALRTVPPRAVMVEGSGPRAVSGSAAPAMGPPSPHPRGGAAPAINFQKAGLGTGSVASMSTPASVTLVVDDGEGGRERLVLSGPGGEVRFTVGDSSHHSGVWKIWATKTNASVYAAIRDLGGRLKVSLHDGPIGPDYRLQWTAEHEKGNPELVSRTIDKWPRPSEFGNTGWAKGVSIWVRNEDVAPAPGGESLPADVLFLPIPLDGRAIGLHIVIARPTGQFVKLRGMPLCGIMLANGQVALLVAPQAVVRNDTNRMVADALAKLMPSAIDRLDKRRTSRALVWSDGVDGTRQVWDVAVRPGGLTQP